MTGTIKRTTLNYSFRIPIFDAPGWGRELERNYDILDAALFAASGLGGVKGVWTNGTLILVGDRYADESGTLWLCNVEHTTDASGTFEDERTANPTYWTQITETTSFRGNWAEGVTYNVNDYLTDNSRYGIATKTFVSYLSYDNDVAAGNIITLIDISTDIATVASYLEAAQTSADNAATSETNSAASAAASAVSAGEASDSAASASGYADTALSTYAKLVGGTSGQVLLKSSGTDFDFAWANLTGGGDMLRATYDPSNKAVDIYSMDNMDETATKKIFTSTERTKLTGIETGADKTDAGNVSPVLTALATKASIVDADAVIITDSAAAGAPKRPLWSTIKATLKTYFDALYVPVARTVSASTGLTGGGSLNGDISLSVVFGSAAGTSAQGNDARIVNAMQKTGGTFTGAVAGVAPTSASHLTRKDYVDAQIAAIPDPVTPDYGAGNAALGVGTVGTYALVRATDPVTKGWGTTIAGSGIDAVGIKPSTNAINKAADLGGTWRIFGTIDSATASLAMRIA